MAERLTHRYVAIACLWLDRPPLSPLLITSATPLDSVMVQPCSRDGSAHPSICGGALRGLKALIGSVTTFFAGIQHFCLQAPCLAAMSYMGDERPMHAISAELDGRSPAETLVGIHPFGDFLLSHYWARLDVPWLDLSNYRALALAAFKAFDVSPYRVAL